MNIQLSEHFDYKKLFFYTLPTVVMLIFSSIYGIVDGFFISNFVGKTAFTAVNFIIPFLMILGSFGFMFGSGASALIGKTLGEGKREKANVIFSQVVYSSIITGIFLVIIGLLILEPVAIAMGATGQMLQDARLYSWFLIPVIPVYLLQMEFQILFSTAQKPTLGLYFTLGAGCMNMVLDYLLVGVFKWGIPGAALATAASEIVGGLLPLFYFARKNDSLLRLCKAKLELKPIVQTCTNGFSELLSNVSVSLVSMLYNMQLLRYAGEDGVAAYGVMMYLSMIFMAVFLGYSTGIAPVFSFQYGAANHHELKSLLRKSLVWIFGLSVWMTVSSFLLADPLSLLFVGYDPGLHSMTVRGFSIFSFSFLFSGLAIFGSAFFTALNNGLVSALISFLRTLVFQIAAVMVFPFFWGIDGIWWSLTASDALAAAVAILLIFTFRKKYHY